MTEDEKTGADPARAPQLSTLPDPADLMRARVLPAEFSRIMGVSRQCVSGWIQRGVITQPGPDGRIDLATATREVFKNTDPARTRARVVKQASASHDDLRKRVRELEAELERRNAGDAVDAGEPIESDDADTRGKTMPSFRESRARKEFFAAAEAERQHNIALGKLLDADDCAMAVANAATMLRVQLESLPDVIAPQLVAIRDEARIRALLAAAIEQALTELSRQFSAIAAPASLAAS